MRENKKRFETLTFLLFMGILIATLSNINFIREDQINRLDHEEITTFPQSQSSFERLWSYVGADNMRSVAISADGHYIAAGCDNTNFYLFNKTSSVPLINQISPDDILSVAISSDGSYSVAGSKSGHVYFFNKTSLVWNNNVGNDVRCVDISSDGTYIVAGNDAQEVYLFNKASSTELWSRGVSGKIMSIAISLDGQYIVAGTDSDWIYLFSQSSSTPLWSFQAGDQILSVAISSDGSHIAAGSKDNYVYVFESSSSTPIQSYNTGNEVLSVSISADGQYIVTGNSADYVYLYDKSSSTPMWSYTNGGAGDFRTVDISADGEFIVAGSYDNKVYIFNQSSSTPLWSYTTGGDVFSVSISSDGRYFTAGGQDRDVHLFEQIFPLGPFELSTNAGNPDTNGVFHLNWNKSLWADNYSVYTFASAITEINQSVTLLEKGLTNLSYKISGLTDNEYHYAIQSRNKYYNETSNDVKVIVQFSSSIAKFDVLENASSNLYESRFNVFNTSFYNVSVPLEWNAELWNLNLNTYSKEQQLNDTEISESTTTTPWENTPSTSGTGELVQSWLPTESNPNYLRTILQNSGVQGFNQDDYVYWTQNLTNLNNELEIEEGALFQAEDETTIQWDDFTTNTFTTDLNTPYGGLYNPPFDIVTLDRSADFETLNVYIEPNSGANGRNPSASWNNVFYLPYEIEYAQITINWEVDPTSSFEVADTYQVSARIDEEYIAGSQLISKNDSLPYIGTNEALIVYNDGSYLDHGVISRTYNITEMLEGRIGNHTLDFGAWAKNPTHLGDIDNINVKFHSIEINYNTTAKYEVASLEFDYKFIDTKDSGSNVFSSNGNASLNIILDNSSSQEMRRIMDLSQMDLRQSSEQPFDYNHITYSISQDLLPILNSDNINFTLALLFEDDFETVFVYTLDIDNINFYINYKHDNVSYSGLEYEIDNLGWNNMSSPLIDVDVSSWSSGDIHSIRFLSNNSNYLSNLYVNIQSNLSVNTTLGAPNGAYALYYPNEVNSSFGVWNITYENRDSYYNLEVSPYFFATDYSIGFIDLPAFDSLQSNSNNWDIFNALTPDNVNVSQSDIIRFIYSAGVKNQSAKIKNAFDRGMWTLQARQPNFIANCTFNNTEEYLGLPSYFFNEFLEYNFSLRESDPVDGNYSLILYDSEFSIKATYPRYLNSSESSVVGNIDILSSYSLGLYHLSIEWNDTADIPGQTIRFGSIIKSFYIFNNTNAAIYNSTALVQAGNNATFKIYYRTAIGDYSIPSPDITVYDNTTGTLKLWGVDWKGEYQASITPLTEGNHSIILGTEGSTAGNYSIVITCEEEHHIPQTLTFNISIFTLPTSLVVNITAGATKNATSHWVLNSNNIPYVNDTHNSILQLNLTDSGDFSSITGASVIGTIGTSGRFFFAVELGGGIYNLTIDTTGLNATLDGMNTTLYIYCIAGGYNLTLINVTIEIQKITMQTTLQSVPPVYAEGEITLIASLENLYNKEYPEDNNYGNLTYYIHQGGAPNLTGTLEFLINGIYREDISLKGLPYGIYSIYINSAAPNCHLNTSNSIVLIILSQNDTNIQISIDTDPVRILQQFEIEATLTYDGVGLAISGQSINFNVTITHPTETDISFHAEEITDLNGKASLIYTISEEYKDGILEINVTFNGYQNMKANGSIIIKTIFGRKPIIISISNTPSFNRVGYSATYGGTLSIEGESTAFVELFFIAEYDNKLPFLTQQIFTDLSGNFEYTIAELADGYENLTIFIEHKKTLTVAYNLTSITESILPKWEVNFTYEDLSSMIRFGQVLQFKLQINCSENSSLVFTGLPITFEFKYGTTTVVDTAYINENNELVLTYRVADSFEGNLSIVIEFTGTNRFTSYAINISFVVDEKLNVQLSFVEPHSTQYLVGLYFFSIFASDMEGNSIEGLRIYIELLDENGDSIESLNASTDDQGIASFSIDFENVGNGYSLKISFLEEGIYSGALLTSDNLRIIDGFIIFLDILPFILILIAIATGAALAFQHLVIKPKREKQRELLSQMYQRLSDAENIQHVLVLTEAGLPCVNKSITELPIDGTLVSGFLSAISSFGQQLGSTIKDKKGSKGDIRIPGKEGLEELAYGRFRIILSEGQYSKTALLLLKRPSTILWEKCRKFTEYFEEIYKGELQNFTGEVMDDIPVNRMLEKIFEVDLLYPHQVLENKSYNYISNLTKKQVEYKILTEATLKKFENNFYLRDMIEHLKLKGLDEIEVFKALEKLRKEKILNAINPEIEQIIKQIATSIAKLTNDDRNVLVAIYNGYITNESIKEYAEKNELGFPKNIDKSFIKLKKMYLIDEENQISDLGIILIKGIKKQVITRL